MFKIQWKPFLALLSIISFSIYTGLFPDPYPFANLHQIKIAGIAGNHWLHFSVFFSLYLIGPTLIDPIPSLWLIYGGLIVAAPFTEFFKSLFPWKLFDWGNVIANFVGIAAGVSFEWCRLLVYPNSKNANSSVLKANVSEIV